MKNWVLLLFFGLTSQLASAQFVIVQKNIPKTSIVFSENEPYSKDAALLLQRFVKEISGAQLELISNPPFPKENVIILQNNRYDLQEDEFYISSTAQKLLIEASGDQGIIYGVVEILEQFFGVRYFGAFEYYAPQKSDLILPLLDTLHSPTFSFRQTQFYGISQDPLYKIWHRLETPAEIFVNNLWVHTFDRILPADSFGGIYPEYYSFFNGKRHPGKASQWCLTNEDLFDLVVQKLEGYFENDPSKKIISVSQNDGNFTQCACENCKKIDDENGSSAGSLVYFMNKLAQKFPDKEISTLAYLYSMNPPTVLKPLPNVNIMLCSIDADREVPLTDNRSGQAFVKALKGWSAISENIFVWDYGINFDNYLSPFPNFHVLQDNIQLFRDHHVKYHFSQIGGSKGGNFAELRAYLVAKLLWNANADVDKLTREFLHGYYGQAGDFLYQYLKIMEGALLASGRRLWIYDTPVTHKEGMLNPALLKTYQKLFDQAEESVSVDSLFLQRVQIARLPIMFSELEIARTTNWAKEEEIEKKLKEFENLARRYTIRTLNERNNSPLDYAKLYRTRYLNKYKNLASGKSVNFIDLPHNRYRKLGEFALTDGLYGGMTFGESWVGWEGRDAAMILDLGNTEEINKVSVDFLHQLGSWILVPQSVQFSYSLNGVDFKPLAMVDVKEDRDPAVKFVEVVGQTSEKISARYIKIDITGVKICPDWHYGVGSTCWFFMDEIKVE
ncbi:MAG: hypothetical protein RJA52_191 [Bacteroidota bacterium]